MDANSKNGFISLALSKDLVKNWCLRCDVIIELRQSQQVPT